MEPIQIAEDLKTRFIDDVIGVSEFRGQTSVTVKKDNIINILRYLHDSEDADMKYLQDLSAVDYPERDSRFEVVYHLHSFKFNTMLRIKALVTEKDCRIDSATVIWKGANWHERECFDMFGVVFKGHPDLRRILLPEDWIGYPLRKDYPAKGPDLENDWHGFKEVLDKSQKFKAYAWER